METVSALLALFAGNSPVAGEFPAQRPVTRRFDVFCDLRLNKRLSKQSWGWWFETPSCSLWRHCNVCELFWEPGCWNRSVYCICKPSLITLYNYIYVWIFIIMLSYWGTPKFSKKMAAALLKSSIRQLPMLHMDCAYVIIGLSHTTRNMCYQSNLGNRSGISSLIYN